jgi:Bacterial regulatory protein, Fis family
MLKTSPIGDRRWPVLVVAPSGTWPRLLHSRTPVPLTTLAGVQGVPYGPTLWVKEDQPFIRLPEARASAALGDDVFVNDVPLRGTQQLHDGDEIRLGAFRILLLPPTRPPVSLRGRLASHDEFEAHLTRTAHPAYQHLPTAIALFRLPSLNSAARTAVFKRLDSEVQHALVSSLWTEFASDTLGLLATSSEVSRLSAVLPRLAAQAGTRAKMGSALIPVDTPFPQRALARALESILDAPASDEAPLYSSAAMVRLRNVVETGVPSSSPLLLVGAPGSGRATLASASVPPPFTLLRDIETWSPAHLRQQLAQAPHRVVATSTEAHPSFQWAIHIPPLSSRPSDVIPLAEAFLAEARLRLKRPKLWLSTETHVALEQHRWEGEVLELKNMMFRAALLAVRDEVGFDGLPRALNPDVSTAQLRRALASTERGLLLEALARTQWNVTATAKRLGVPRRTVVYRMAKLKLKRPRRVATRNE